MVIARNGTEDPGGFTMVEIVVAIAILGILVMLSVSSFKELSEKYGVEAETKQLYADLTTVRGQALQRNRYHFVRITANGYATYEDTSPSPDGNRSYDDGSDTQIVNVTVKHAITTALTGGANDFEFNRHGIASVTGYIRFSAIAGSNANPDYDCVTIRETRINTGRYNNAGVCVEK